MTFPPEAFLAILFLLFSPVQSTNPHQKSCGGFAGFVCPSDETCVMPVGTCNVADAMGVCHKKADYCTEQYDPVCGCDGKTYGNECEATMIAGVTIARRGRCTARKAVCGGIAGAICAADQVCKMPAGMCNVADLQGECVERPQVCTADYSPVCGCDGKTYSNPCVALAAGAAVARPGECDHQTSGGCGGITGRRCADGQVCMLPPGKCNIADFPGKCVDRPEVCTLEYSPVCGCDGRTYSNKCDALSAGASVASFGECSSQKDQVCGGSPAVACSKGQLCKKPVHTCNNPAAPGLCMEVPAACTDDYTPVCGCDALTYPNECAAWSNKTMVDHPGPCDQSCQLGDGRVREGWSGSGVGSNWCNNCVCRKGGLICTKKACGKNPHEGKGCDLGSGVHVPNGWHGKGAGSNWCNSCNCNENGLACTKMMCPEIDN